MYELEEMSDGNSNWFWNYERVFSFLFATLCFANSLYR